MSHLPPSSLLVLLALFALGGTAQAKKPPAMSPQEMAQAAVDDSMVAAMSTYQASALAAPGDLAAATAWAGVLSGAADAGTVGRGKVASADLDAFFATVDAAKGNATGLGTLYGMAAKVAAAAGRTDTALALANAALDKHPTSTALITWLQVASDPGQASSRCTATLKAAASDIQRFDTLTACDAAIGTDWASAADRNWYAAEQARRGASQAAHTAELQARWQEQGEAAAARVAEEAAARKAAAADKAAENAASAATTAGSSTVSVSMHISCGTRVRMFQGSSPNSGGTYGWESPNTTRSFSVRTGSVICIADERDKIQSCWTASGTRVDLDVGCGGFMQK